jgi:Kef-type K+ transport system membrane component KefB
MIPLFLQLALALAILISAAKLGGYLSVRWGQPAVLGELLAGLALGPSFLDFLHRVPFTAGHLGEIINCLAEVGVLLLMFIAGLDLHLSDLAKSGKVAVLAGTMGVLFPVAMGFGLGQSLAMAALPALFIGLILAATSVSISAQTLMELKVLRSRVGITLLGAAVFDDILVMLGLSMLVALTNSVTGGLISVGVVLLRMGSFLIGASVLGLWWLPKLSQRVDNLPVSQGLIAFTFVAILFYAWTAEVWGNMAAITGAFLAGMFLARSPLKDQIQTGVSTLAYSVFVPIFFTNVGLSANGRLLTLESAGLVLAMIGVAVLSKVLGSAIGARLGGFSNHEALELGVGMMSRGEVGLIVASLGMAEGIISGHVFSAMVGVVIATTLLTPPMLRALFVREGIPVPQLIIISKR